MLTLLMDKSSKLLELEKEEEKKSVFPRQDIICSIPVSLRITINSKFFWALDFFANVSKRVLTPFWKLLLQI